MATTLTLLSSKNGKHSNSNSMLSIMLNRDMVVPQPIHHRLELELLLQVHQHPHRVTQHLPRPLLLKG